MITIANEWLRAEISPAGAELKSLKRLEGQHEYLWSADPQYWAKTSPVLFPIVGALKDDTYHYEGRSYRLPRHGFARDKPFDGKLVSPTEAAFTLTDSEETRAVYPFAFQLTLRYRLEGHSITCTYEVRNPSDSQPLLFSIGAHPAFAAPAREGGPAYSDYFLEFPGDEALVCHKLEGNLVSAHTETIALDEHRRLPLRHDLFYADALVLKTLRSKTIILGNTINDRGITFHHEGFSYFGIWAAKDADFVCLEPWCGIADHVGHRQQLEEKEGIQRLEAGDSWTRSWSVNCF
ncbi:aldose 1-epimerase family protein [Parapedobacter koreensis]|uniref:Galactose mutarotase n=1 Tax=Parapedobacter koreensis TaxID=332977 RepID=A0A1H7LK57_9SPHI|nr:aldose 1-epimerase family protein [Parapedobacter koreensis]SEK99301.1 Galactose mutarotase [Parapedobacter koreensis]